MVQPWIKCRFTIEAHSSWIRRYNGMKAFSPALHSLSTRLGYIFSDGTRLIVIGEVLTLYPEFCSSKQNSDMGGCQSTGSRLVNFKQISRQLSLLELLELKRGNKWISVNIDDDDDCDDG